jgi:Undecaprenyl-phosphate glucose phosphotransferase
MFDPTLRAMRPDGAALHSVAVDDPIPRADWRPAPLAAVAALLAVFDVAVAVLLPLGLHWIVAGQPAGDRATGAIALAAMLLVLFCAGLGGYRASALLHPRQPARAALRGGGLSVFVTALAALLFGAHAPLSPRWALAAGVLTPAALAVSRFGLAAILASDRRRRFALRTILIGGGSHAARLLAQLRESDDRSMRLIGYADDRSTRLAPGVECTPFLGSVEQALQLIRGGSIDQVIVALPWSAEARMLGLLRQLADYPGHVRLAPDLILYHFAGRACTEVAGLPLLHLLDRPISGIASLLKRAEDVLLGAIALALLALPMLLIALAVRLETPGPALFRQRRTGFNNCEFEMFKFRTMQANAPAEPHLRQTTRNDPRVTRVGAILRRASLDELPQLLNVLRGEMSLVGPRPHAPGTRAGGRPFEQVVASYAARHRVRPGLTGLAQVRGLRGETETVGKLAKRVESDLEYIENWSLWLDISILFRTALAVVSMRNAY